MTYVFVKFWDAAFGCEGSNGSWTPEVAGRSAKAPGSKHHGLADIRRGLQNRLDAADQGDRRTCPSGALSGDQHDGIAFVQVSQRRCGHSAEHLLNVRSAAGTAAHATSARGHSPFRHSA